MQRSTWVWARFGIGSLGDVCESCQLKATFAIRHSIQFSSAFVSIKLIEFRTPKVWSKNPKCVCLPMRNTISARLREFILCLLIAAMFDSEAMKRNYFAFVSTLIEWNYGVGEFDCGLCTCNTSPRRFAFSIRHLPIEGTNERSERIELHMKFLVWFSSNANGTHDRLFCVEKLNWKEKWHFEFDSVRFSPIGCEYVRAVLVVTIFISNFESTEIGNFSEFKL